MTYFFALLFTSSAALDAAIAVLYPTQGNTAAGVISVTSTNNNTHITGKVTGLAASTVHGFHIHVYGNLNSTDGTAAGGHYNPFNVLHACPPNARHVGDLGNVTSNANGEAMLDLTFTEAEVPFNLTIGRAFIVHSGSDDCVTQPTGNAGARLAQGVIGTLSLQVAVSSSENHGIAVLTSASSTSVTGLVNIQTLDGSTKVSGWVKGLPANSNHAFHIHQYGNLNSTDGNAAGSHWNPTGASHSCAPPRHAGDFANISSDASGVAWFDFTRTETELAVHTVIGRPFIVHQFGDDCVTQSPPGNAGARWAQGVIGIAPLATPTPTGSPTKSPTSMAPTTMAPTGSTTASPTSVTTNSPTKAPTSSAAGYAFGVTVAVTLASLLM